MVREALDEIGGRTLQCSLTSNVSCSLAEHWEEQCRGQLCFYTLSELSC